MLQAKTSEANAEEKIEELIRRHNFRRQNTKDKKLFVEADEGRLLRDAGGVKIGGYFNDELGLWITNILFRERIFVAATKQKM